MTEDTDIPIFQKVSVTAQFLIHGLSLSPFFVVVGWLGFVCLFVFVDKWLKLTLKLINKLIIILIKNIKIKYTQNKSCLEGRCYLMTMLACCH